MQRNLSIVGFLLLTAIQCFSQGPCQAKPGDTTIIVPLSSNSMEPTCEPSRIRVSDRTSVMIKIVNVSPVEVCAASSKPPTLTAVTNPLESIINTITGYKSFDFAGALPAHQQAMQSLYNLYGTPPPERKPKEKTPDESARDLFRELADKVFPAAKVVADKQNTWQALYKADTDELTKYIAADYRGTLYSKFDPDNDPELATVQSHTKFPPISINAGDVSNPPSEIDYAPLQALIDEMKALQPRLIAACTTPDAAGKPPAACDPEILAKTAELIDQANGIMLVLQDNLKSLQTAQAAIVTSVAVLHKIKVDFNARIKAKTVEAVVLAPGKVDKILVQTIPLGTDYGATDPGTISCSTDTSPAVATTDTINYAILYQNVPAFTVSAGLLTTFLEKRIIGTTQQLDADGKTVDTVFAVTDSARASVFPMAFVNYRVAPPILTTWWGQPNSELVITHNVSAGIGINSNTGTNQPEFFGGYAIGFSRVLIHAGLHYGRTESLGGGFSYGKVPSGFTGAAPIDWSYHPAFAFGFSVRIAPF